MSFEHKYLKYKQKYLDLKKELLKSQNGGAEINLENSSDSLDIDKLTETPVFKKIFGLQKGGQDADMDSESLGVDQLSDTPNFKAPEPYDSLATIYQELGKEFGFDPAHEPAHDHDKPPHNEPIEPITYLPGNQDKDHDHIHPDDDAEKEMEREEEDAEKKMEKEAEMEKELDLPEPGRDQGGVEKDHDHINPDDDADKDEHNHAHKHHHTGEDHESPLNAMEKEIDDFDSMVDGLNDVPEEENLYDKHGESGSSMSTGLGAEDPTQLPYEEHDEAGSTSTELGTEGPNNSGSNTINQEQGSGIVDSGSINIEGTQNGGADDLDTSISELDEIFSQLGGKKKRKTTEEEFLDMEIDEDSSSILSELDSSSSSSSSDFL